MQQENENGPRETSTNRKILFIICIYIFLTFSSRPSDAQSSTQQKFRQKFKYNNVTNVINYKEVLGLFIYQTVYEGRWEKTNGDSKDFGLDGNGGKFLVVKYRSPLFSDQNAKLGGERLQIKLYNGQYMDYGILSIGFTINSSHYTTSMKDKNTMQFSLLPNTTTSNKTYIHQKILQVISQGYLNATLLPTVNIIDNKTVKLNFDLEINDKINLKLYVTGSQRNLLKITIFALVMFIVSYCPFSSILQILKKLFNNEDQPRNYSLVTLTLTAMWDCFLCIISFMYAFKSNQEGLILFILPAFLLCLMFTNLQLRVMMMIFLSSRTNNNTNMRWNLCKFNLISYGSLFLIGPIIYFTNFGWPLFIGMSCIIFPQIYTNGFTGNRPQVYTGYYFKFLLTRFIIIFYVKCFPMNIFDISPDYFLSFFCLCIIIFQIGLLYIQKMYGSKKVLPSFMLEPIYDYKFQQENNCQDIRTDNSQETQCSICLMPSSQDPVEQSQGQPRNQLPSCRLMKTPCNHIYHTSCLASWMKIKMECPQCRANLPPYQ